MNRGLLAKSWREALPVTLGLGVLALLLELILALALPKLQREFGTPLQQLPFMQNIVSAMIGSEIKGGFLGPAMFAAIPWVHPVLLAVCWTQAMVLCTRVPAAEVDRGTVDVLFALPASRWQVFVAETIVILGSLALVVVLAFCGNVIGARVGGNVLNISLARLGIVALNLLALNVCVGAFALAISALSDRRGRALGVCIVVVLASFLLNYLGQFWDPVKSIAWLSVLNYHRPMPALQEGTWPARDIATLLGVALALWVSAGVILARRDLATT